MSLEFRGGYQLEFAIDSENEFKALNILADIFGKQIKNEVKFYGMAKRSELIFISHRFTKDELTDENYNKLLNYKDTLLIINDELSAKRAGELIQICIPVETLLKRLLIYVWPEIYIALGAKNSEKIKIEICKQIYGTTLGNLISLLEVDLTAKNREQLFADDGKNLIQILEDTSDFDDLKKKLLSLTKPHTVWGQISVVLKSPVPYSVFSKQLNRLRILRNKAAHPQVILAKDIVDAQKCSKHILMKIGEVRNDYYDDLVKSINKFVSSIETLTKFSEINIPKILAETTAALSKTLNKSIIEATYISPPRFDLSKFLSRTNWNTINTEMKTNDPEMRQILDNFENNGTKPTLDKINNEIKKDIGIIKKQDKSKDKRKINRNKIKGKTPHDNTK